MAFAYTIRDKGAVYFVTFLVSREVRITNPLIVSPTLLMSNSGDGF